MDTDDGEEEAVEEDAGDEWDDGRCGQDGMIQQERQNNIINILGGHSYAM